MNAGNLSPAGNITSVSPDPNFSAAVQFSLKEDHADQDITSKFLLHSNQRDTAQIIAKESGALCGVDVARFVFLKVDPQCVIQQHAKDGDKIKLAQKILTIKGRSVKLLSAERTALNFLQHLSGIATLTKKFVNAVEGTKAKIYDTRKTIPGLRALQKYAVRCGGGTNHRMNLSEMAMVKDNHLKAVESLEFRVESLKSKLPGGMLLEMEAKNLKEVALALKSKADIIMLDNMSVPQLKKAIRFIHSCHLPLTHASSAGRRRGDAYRLPLIEISGGVTLKNVRKIAKLGVDRISVGALTHSAPALNISLEVKHEKPK